MDDANLVKFYSRVADHQTSHGKGYGHEAPGTLGRSVTYGVPKKRLRLRLMPVVYVAIAAFGLKLGILNAMGPAAYQDFVAQLSQGQGFGRLGGWLLQVDPVTAYVAEKIALAAAALNA
jgi:hypothetical protein